MSSVNSLCSVYAELLEYEIAKSKSDKLKIKEYLDFIKTNCHTIATPKGEMPEQLKPYLIEKDACKGVTGTIIYKGKLIPKVAKCVAERKTR